MRAFWIVALLGVGLWRLSLGEPLWLIPVAIAVFVEWFTDPARPARYGRPPDLTSREPEAPQRAERPR